MNNLDKAFEHINNNKFEVENISFIGKTIRLHINTKHAFEAAKMAATQNWYKVSEQMPKIECDVRLYDIRAKRYSTAKFKENYFEISYIGNTPVCIGENQYPFLYWSEMPVFNKA
jgi:hypothetical protein